MTLCEWNGGNCDRQSPGKSGFCDMHSKMTRTVEASLAAGLIDTEQFKARNILP
jgi:hypothetical protein